MSRRTGAVLTAAVLLMAGLSALALSPHPELDKPEFASFRDADTPFDGGFKVVAFNLERGVHFDEEVAYLSSLREQGPALILLLSECDKFHSRSNDRFVARDIARALHMDMLFVVEYVEFNDKTPETPATHGNAILSPFPLSDVSVIRHREVYSWQRWGWFWGQPRRGGVVALGATVNFPDGSRTRVYSLHLESNTIQTGRALQLRDVLPEAESFDGPLVLGGDLNSIPGTEPQWDAKRRGLKNAFAGNWTPTGWCYFHVGDELRCVVKIDWIFYRGLELEGRDVKSLLTRSGKRVSDHAAVSASFRMTGAHGD